MGEMHLLFLLLVRSVQVLDKREKNMDSHSKKILTSQRS